MPKAMGKVPNAASAATAVMKGKKKAGPSGNTLPCSKPSLSNFTNRRSTRRNPSNFNSPPQPEFDDDEDERKEKKVKLVVRLPQSDEKAELEDKHQQIRSRRHSRDSASGSGSDSVSGSDQDSPDREGCAKKRKINNVDRGSDNGVLDQDKEVVKATDSYPLNGSPLKSGLTTPLPDKKLLVFILDRLQKKDTYGVFSEPADPNELPDYFDIIEQPMDFGTVRKKLDKGAYRNLEDLEADVLLICCNAMQYNSSDTVYYRQARTIQELAKRDFQNLKHEGEDGEPQPKVVRRGRPPSIKNQKKSLETSPVDRVGHVDTEASFNATPAKIEDKAAGSHSNSNSYNLRKPAFIRTRSADPFVSSQHSRNGENYSEWSTDWNNEFPASILRADMKYGKKQFTVDEYKRDTYRQSLALGNSTPILSNSFGNMKRLVPVGLQEPFAFARSLARFAANLGPVAWKIASKKIEAVLPAGVEYGPGWVGDNGTPSQSMQKPSDSTAGECSSSKLISSAVSHRPSEGVDEAVRKLNSESELSEQRRTPFPSQIQQSYRNGFSGMYGYDLSARIAIPGHSLATNGISQTMETNDVHSSAANPVIPDGHSKLQVAQGVGQAEMWNMDKSGQQRHSNLSVPPDLNARVPAGSPNSSLQIGSPKQPDLVLQL